MRIARFNPNNRVAIAVGTSIGVGNVLLRASMQNFGQVAGVAVGVVATAIISATIYWALEWSFKS